MTVRNAVSIIGAGVQGRRLAYMWSSRGHPVRLVDRQASALESALSDIEKLKLSAEKASSHENGEIKTFPESGMEEALRGSWLVVENVPEKLTQKRDIVKKLDSLSSPETIIASNSSSFTITEVVDNLSLSHPERCVNLHSYWPPETAAIEIMGHAGTKGGIIEHLMRECKEHGFSPFHVKRNSTGYIYNRIWAAIKRESLLVASEGVASPSEIDAIYKDVLKTPMGPFEQMDVVGLDSVLAIEEHYADVRDGLPREPRELLEKMIAEGKLGVKNGRGFYEHGGR